MVQHKKNQHWFTLVEILVVMAVVAIISTLGFVSYSWYLKDGNDFKRISDVTMLKTQLEIHKKTQLFYPTLSGATNIMSGAELIASQSIIDDALAWRLNIANSMKDPKTGMSYIYSVSKDASTYQIATTLENTNNLLGSNVMDTAYAENGQNSYTALVQGNFIAENKNTLPGLVYAVVNGEKFVPGTPPSFDMSTESGKARAILNGQNTNLAYDMNGKMIGNDGTLSLSGLLSQTSVIENSAINQFLYCSGSLKKYAPGENEIIETMTGRSIGQKIGWKYTTCDGDTGTMSAVKYACANIQGADFGADCTWNSCQSGYTALQAPDAAAPFCVGNILAPVLYYPQNGAYNTPVTGNLSWNSVPQSNGTYKVYFGTEINSLQLVNSVNAVNYAFVDLAKGTTYYWKIQTCDANSQCANSQTWSFTTLPEQWGVYNGTGSVASNEPDTAYCPTGIVCRADDVTVEYIGCNAGSSSFTDCSQDNFGTSERSGQEWYGTTKTLGYRIKNNSNGTARFKMQLATPTGAYAEKYSATNFDSESSMYLWGDGLMKNYYWKKWEGCGGDGLSGYTVVGKSACYIQFYYRSSPAMNDYNGKVWKFKVLNTDTANGMWPDTQKELSGNISGYTLSELVLANTGSKYAQSGEPSGITTVLNDFDTSSIISGKQYGYWKTLTYTVTNTNNSTSYFNVWVGEDSPASITVIESTGWLDADFGVAGWNLDIGENGVGNLYFYNGDFQGNDKCTPYGNGLSIGNNASCKITLFFRADQSVSATSSVIANLRLSNQPIVSPDAAQTIGLYGKKLGGNTLLFTGFFPYSQNGWWIDFSGFQIQDDLTPTWYVWSHVMGWIDMSGQEPGSTLKIKYVSGVKKIRGKTWGQTAGWIDFDKVTDVSKQAYISADGKLHGWTWSQNYGWISFDNGAY